MDTTAQVVEHTNPERLPCDRSHPFIWDNDANHDVFTQEFIMALAHNGTINLAGITEAPHPYRTGAENYQAVVEAARASGLSNIPDAVWDLKEFYMTAVSRPESGIIEDTVPLESGPARFIYDQVLSLGTPAKPVVIGAGGALTNIASAYLMALRDGRQDEFADKVYVCASIAEYNHGKTGMPGYNGQQDAWAAYICLHRLQMAVIAIDHKNGLPLIWDFIEELPDCPLKAYMQWKKGEQWPYPDLHGDCDAGPVLAFLHPEKGMYFNAFTRMSFDSWTPWRAGEHGHESLNWNAYQAEMAFREDAGSQTVFTGDYVQSVADEVWRRTFVEAFGL